MAYNLISNAHLDSHFVIEIYWAQGLLSLWINSIGFRASLLNYIRKSMGPLAFFLYQATNRHNLVSNKLLLGVNIIDFECMLKNDYDFVPKAC